MKNLQDILSSELLKQTEKKELKLIDSLGTDGASIQECNLEEKDLEIIKLAVITDPESLRFIPSKLITEDLCFFAVSIKGTSFKLIPQVFRAELKFIVRALENKGGLDVLRNMNFNHVMEKFNKKKASKNPRESQTAIKLFSKMLHLLAAHIAFHASDKTYLPDWLVKTEEFQRILFEATKKTSNMQETEKVPEEKKLEGKDLNDLKVLIQLCNESVTNVPLILKAKEYSLDSITVELLLPLLQNLCLHDYAEYRKTAIALLQEKGLYLQYIKEQDLYLILNALLQDGLALEHVRDSLKTTAIQYFAIISNPNAIKYCSPSFQNDFFSQLEQDSKFSTSVLNNTALLDSIIDCWGGEAKAKKYFKTILEERITAIFSQRRNGQALEFFSAEEPKKGICTVLFKGISFELSEQVVKTLCLNALHAGFKPVSKELHTYLPSYLLDDVDIQKCLIATDPQYFKKFKNIQGELPIVKNVIEKDIKLLQYISDELKSNIELAQMIIQKDHTLCSFFNKNIWKNSTFVTSVKDFLSKEEYEQYVSDEVKNTLELVLLKKDIQESKLFFEDKEKLCGFNGAARKLKEKFDQLTTGYDELKKKIADSTISQENQQIILTMSHSYEKAYEKFDSLIEIQNDKGGFETSPRGGSPVNLESSERFSFNKSGFFRAVNEKLEKRVNLERDQLTPVDNQDTVSGNKI